MTWEADIVNRFGNLSISGQFKISSASEFQKFIEKMNELAAKSVLRPSSVTARLKEDRRKPRMRENEEVIERHFNELGNEVVQEKQIPKKLPAFINLSSREKQVFDFYHAGLSRPQMAERMGLTYDGVNYHIVSLRKKIARAKS